MTYVMDWSADTEDKNENKNCSVEEMSPKNGYEPTASGNGSSTNVEEEDLQEMEAVNESLDELSTALDFFEQRTDNIIEQLKELLHSNREIRAQLALEKAAAATGPENADGIEDSDS